MECEPRETKWERCIVQDWKDMYSSLLICRAGLLPLGNPVLLLKGAAKQLHLERTYSRPTRTSAMVVGGVRTTYAIMRVDERSRSKSPAAASVICEFRWLEKRKVKNRDEPAPA